LRHARLIALVIARTGPHIRINASTATAALILNARPTSELSIEFIDFHHVLLVD